LNKSDKAQHFVESLSPSYLSQAFRDDEERVEQLSIEACGLRVDFSKQLWSREVLDELIAFHAADANLAHKIDSLFMGKIMNPSESRAAKHHLLRAPANSYLDKDLTEVIKVREQFLDCAQKIYLDESIKYIVNIGIGGSDLGPLMAYQALLPSAKQAFFVSNVDPSDLDRVLDKIELSSTIFIIVSKTFTTQETMLNANRVRDLVEKTLGNSAIQERFLAISTDLDKCKEFGIASDRIFGFWDWVGGRFSLASAVGISIPICFGRDVFNELLAGMHSFDKHFQQTPISRNLAVWHAMSNIFNINYLDLDSLAVIGYSSRLKEFSSYLQQLVMESNGKSVSVDGQKIDHKTAPIIFGEPGTNSQHSFFQALHQGQKTVPVDFIVYKPQVNSIQETELVSNALAQAMVLAFGTLGDETVSVEKKMPGNRPSTLIMVNNFNAFSLGVLIALYEASTIVQGFIWNINSFDQWGVQLGKTVASDISKSIKHPAADKIDPSTKRALKYLF
jgi:glucose-6-phosphate isomerase